MLNYFHHTLRLIAAALLCCLALASSVLSADTGNTAQSNGGLAIALLAAETRFDTNTMVLTAEGAQALKNLLSQLDQYQEILSIRVIGHTDDVGSIEFNKELSTQRADYIRQSFASKYPEIHLVSVGMGELQPIASNTTADGRERNRRVEIQVIARGVMPDSESSGNAVDATNN